MNWQERALAGGLRAAPGVLVGLGNHILPQMWETMQVAGIAQGVVTWKGKRGKRKGVFVFAAAIWEGDGEIHAPSHGCSGETGFRVFLYRECQGV